MNQDKIFEATKKVKETPLEFTRSIIEQSKGLRHPSSKINKIGATIGISLGAVLFFTGGAQLLIGKSSWAISSCSVGALTIMSNFICYNRKND